MVSENYSLLTLNQADEHKKRFVWQFRINSMQSQFQIFTAVVLISFIQSLANAIYKNESAHYWDLSMVGIALTGQIIVMLLSKRCTQRSITYLYPLMFALPFLGLLIKSWLQVGDRREAEWSFERHAECLGETVAVLMAYLCYSTIFCPSLFFMVFVYAPIYIVIHMTYMYLRYDMTDDKVYFFNTRILAVFALQGVLFFLLV